MVDIPQEVFDKLAEIGKKYNVSDDKLADMFIDKFYSEQFISLFPNEIERCEAIIRSIEMDIRSAIRGTVNNIIEIEAIPIGIQQIGRTSVRLYCLVDNEASIISIRANTVINELNRSIENEIFKLFTRKYTLRVRKSNNPQLYFSALDMEFTKYTSVNLNTDPIELFKDKIGAKEVKLKHMFAGEKVSKITFSRINERGFADPFDLRIFKGYIVERTRSGFRFDDGSIEPEDLKTYEIEENKLLRLSRMGVVVSANRYFIREYHKFMSKVPNEAAELLKPYVTVIGTLELRPIQIQDPEYEYYRPHINSVYIKFEGWM